MAVTRFEGDGPVARYWLANCKGFEVKGDAQGVVEELIRDADPHLTTRLVVRTRSRRRTVIAVDEVALVVPAEKLLVVERRRQRRHAQRQARAVPIARAARAGTGRAVAAVVPKAQAAGTTVAAAGPPARQALGSTWRRGAAAAGRVRTRARAAVAAAAAWMRHGLAASMNRVAPLADDAGARSAHALAALRAAARGTAHALAASARSFGAELRATARMMTDAAPRARRRAPR